MIEAQRTIFTQNDAEKEEKITECITYKVHMVYSRKALDCVKDF